MYGSVERMEGAEAGAAEVAAVKKVGQTVRSFTTLTPNREWFIEDPIKAPFAHRTET